MTPLDPEQVVFLGTYCEGLMQSEPFNVLMQRFDQGCYEDLTNTAEHETRKREAIFFKQRGVKEFLNEMLVLVREKDRLTAPSDPDAQEDIE